MAESKSDSIEIKVGMCISQNLAQSVALDVLNNHRSLYSQKASDNCERKITLLNSKRGIQNRRIPGRPHSLKSNCGYFQDDKYLFKLEKFEKLLSTRPTIPQLCEFSWSGIPSKVRGITWRLLCGYTSIKSDKPQEELNRKRQNYWNLVKQYYSTVRDETYHGTYHQIHIDVPRMNPAIPLFQQDIVHQMFERILFVWAIRHPSSGYVQGINDLLTPFLVVFLQEAVSDRQPFELISMNELRQEQRDIIEADSFWCFSKFLDGIQENYVFAQPGIQQKVDQLKKLIQRVDNTLHQHLILHNVDYLQFSFRWLNNLLTRELPLRCIIRLWDTYLSECDSFNSFQLYVCAAFLIQWREKLLRQTNFQSLMLMLQNLPTQSWTSLHVSELVAEAYRLKVMFADAPNHLKFS